MNYILISIALFASLANASIFHSWGEITNTEQVLGIAETSVKHVAPLEQFQPAKHLSTLNEEHFTVLTHSFFPQHSVRVKKSKFCDTTVNAYTGYIDIEARHLFFYFFESRRDPDKDDVIFWTNGGPGASSSIGLFTEIGPCRVLNASGPTFHPESWNTNANIFFLDQPIGVGFSYADYGETVSTAEEAAKDIAAFVSIFFEHFVSFNGRAFHLAGESYGGRYIPLFASAVYDQNAKLIKAGLTPINLTSIMIGNGLTDYHEQTLSNFDMLCTPVSITPVLPIGVCVKLKQILPRCRKWMKTACVDAFDAINCQAASGFCMNELDSAISDAGLNPYDVSKKCDGPSCLSFAKFVTPFLNDPQVQMQIGVDKSASNFSAFSMDINSAFRANMDEFGPSYLYVGALLERGIKVLIYVGTYDVVCNWVGNERWTMNLEWSGQQEYLDSALREWTVDGKRVGLTRQAKGLTFATVEGAGHMAPYDKPREALELVNRWLASFEV